MFFESINIGFHAFGQLPVLICIITSMIVFFIHSLFLIVGTNTYDQISRIAVGWNIVQGTILTIAIIPLMRFIFGDSGGYFPNLSSKEFIGIISMAWLASLLIGIICGICYKNKLFMRLVTPSIVNFVQGSVIFNIYARYSISNMTKSIAKNYDVFIGGITWLGYILLACIIGHILLFSVVIFLLVLSGGSSKYKEAFSVHLSSPLSFLSGFIGIIMYIEYVYLLMQ